MRPINAVEAMLREEGFFTRSCGMCVMSVTPMSRLRARRPNSSKRSAKGPLRNKRQPSSMKISIAVLPTVTTLYRNQAMTEWIMPRFSSRRVERSKLTHCSGAIAVPSKAFGRSKNPSHSPPYIYGLSKAIGAAALGSFNVPRASTRSAIDMFPG